MKPTIAQQFGHPSTIRGYHGSCTGFKRVFVDGLGYVMELTPEQLKWLKRPHALPIPLAFSK